MVGVTLAAMLLLGHASIGRADDVSISLSTTITGSPGSVLTVFGSLTNNTSNTLYFGSDAIDLTAPGTVATASDDIILNGLLGSGPSSIAAGAVLTDVELFSVKLLGGPGVYSGNTFNLFGGTDGAGCASGASDCASPLGSAAFSVIVKAGSASVPEPDCLALCSIGALLMGFRPRRRLQSTTYHP
jgi:hypothetical protein